MGLMFILIVSTVAGMIGWWVGSFFGIVVAFVISMLASVIGYYYGAKWNREYFG